MTDIQGNLVPAGKGRAPQEAEPLSTLSPPAPGTYWRVRKNFKGQHDERTQANPLRRGLVLMLASIEHADGEPHVYHFAPHPSWPESLQIESLFHAADFYTWFEPAPDAEAVRAAELRRLLDEMEHTKTAMLEGPPPATGKGRPQLTAQPAIGTPGQALATTDQVAGMLQRADQLREDAESRSKWIQTHSDQLGDQGQALARYHQERAQAALARARSQLDSVAGLLRTVENLNLYVGEDVDVMPLRDGQPAPADEPLTIYQELLALDEEALILLDQGGLDHTRTESLVQALEDPALLQRLIPAPRGVVLARFRASYKEFIPPGKQGGNYASALRNAAMNQESQRVRLLVRDGDRLWLVTAEAALKGIKQLMPSSAEQAAYFEDDHFDRRRPPRRITKDHLDYAKAQRAQLGALDSYGKALILLWGLHDRLDLFEGAQIPKFASWLDPGFQQRYLRLVSQDAMLVEQRPDFGAWQREQNAYLVAGSWVAVDLGRAFTQENAPGAYSSGSYSGGRYRYDQFYQPRTGHAGVLIERVRTDAQGLFVEVPCRYAGYRHDVSRQEANVKLTLARHADATQLADGVLVLDRVRASDLSYYLQSRRQRRGYAAYVTLFREARTWVAARDADEMPLREQLHQAVLDAQLPHDGAHLPNLITDALAVARTARRDRAVPAPGTSGFRRFVQAALAALHASLTDNGARIAAIEACAAEAGRTPLRLVLAGKGQWLVYLEPSTDEHDPRMGEPVHATRAQVSFQEGGATIQAGERVLLRQVAGEQVIHDWPAAPAWLAKRWASRLSYAKAIETLDATQTQGEAFQKGVDLMALVEEATRYMREKSKGAVERMPLVIGVGAALRDGVPFAVALTADAIEYAYQQGDDTVKAACRASITRMYQNPGTWLKRLGEGDRLWWPRLMALDDAAANCAGTKNFRGSRLEPDDIKGAKGSRRVTVMAVHPVATRLVPWLKPPG